ncbi:L-ribulose-5-phosphate 4-epimerase AraD, partial [Lactobacillus mellis]|uniref:L-ribulose-5-phosphate 4-epimerase AraD n=1 Tax=Bombilactobacillus mellis TaxID=1218508 RepID=UPI0015810529
MLEELKQEVYEANMQLPQLDLVTFTWGNVSGIDRQRGLFVIKPSGVAYADLKPSDLVVVNLKGEVVEGDLNPSSDTPTHTVLYNAFPNIGGIVHTHSPWAVSFAAAGLDIPALNTTHADTFYTAVPSARALTQAEIEADYEGNTGKAIVETFEQRHLDYEATPAALVSQHGPFSWGKDAAQAVYNA